MKIVMVMPVFNEVKKGNLEKCLENAKKLKFDNIIILDDGSEDNSYEVAKQYTDLVFRNEKNSLLNKGVSRWWFLANEALKLNPDWIYIQSADCLFARQAFDSEYTSLRKTLEYMSEKYPSTTKLKVYEAQLWRSKIWHRVDVNWGWWTKYGESRIWKVPKDKKINMVKEARLHQSHHFPVIGGDTAKINNFTTMHYGWSTYKLIVEKFRRYMKVAKTNPHHHPILSPRPEDCPPPENCWKVNSFKVLEEYGMQLEKIKEEWFDEKDKPGMSEPRPKPICSDGIIAEVNPRMARLYREHFIKKFGEYRCINL